MVESRELKLLSLGDDIQEILDESEKFAAEMNLDSKEAMRLRLLTEETMVMIRQITGEPEMILIFIGQGSKCTIHLEIETWVNNTMRDNLIGLSKSGRNEAVKGVLGKISEMVERFIYMKDSDLQKLPSDDVENILAMGTPSTYSCAGNAGMTNTMYWTLRGYTENVKAARGDGRGAKEAWDELEKSVVANLADDVRIWIKGSKVMVDIVKVF